MATSGGHSQHGRLPLNAVHSDDDYLDVQQTPRKSLLQLASHCLFQHDDLVINFSSG